MDWSVPEQREHNHASSHPARPFHFISAVPTSPRDFLYVGSVTSLFRVVRSSLEEYVGLDPGTRDRPDTRGDPGHSLQIIYLWSWLTLRSLDPAEKLGSGRACPSLIQGTKQG
jgi:hypothetical protein